ncbi:MAG: hypothetical protein MJZ87_02925 [Bacteroidales bacterium]|nr:hypothetical protein [Bacteroidales bacterium]
MKKIWCFYFLLFYLCSCCNTPDNQTINITLSSQGNVVVLNSEIDTSKEITWEDYGFSQPYVLSQELIFYNKGICAKRHKIPIPKHRFIVNGQEKEFQEIPIFDMELLKGANGVYLHLYGANYCCGEKCPEFNGLYLLDGTIVSECLSTMNSPLNGKEISEIDIDLSKSIRKKSIFYLFDPL